MIRSRDAGQGGLERDAERAGRAGRDPQRTGSRRGNGASSGISERGAAGPRSKGESAHLRVALVGDWPPPHGGVSVHVAALARHLRARGHAVRVLDIGRGDHSGPDLVPARGLVRYAAALAGAAARRELIHVHTSGANAKSWLVALAASRARLPGAPRGALTLHSGSCPAYLAGAPERRQVALAACLGFGRVVAVNREIAGALAACGVPPGRIAVLPAFTPSQVEPGPPPPALAALRARHRPLLCAAVMPSAIYGEDLLLEAFERVRQRFPEAGLVLFGPGSAVPCAADGDGLHRLGELPHPSALAAIAAADLFVRPTRADGDAITVREALALGRTVVASAVGHRPPGCLLFPPGDAAALAARLVEALALPLGGAPVAVGPDPLDALVGVYHALRDATALSRSGPVASPAPTFKP
jgi:glycosyltransferase involved in cell wall biosynthesis